MAKNFNELRAEQTPERRERNRLAAEEDARDIEAARAACAEPGADISWEDLKAELAIPADDEELQRAKDALLKAAESYEKVRARHRNVLRKLAD